MTYLVLDIETDSKTTFRKWNNPFDPNNKIIMVQGKRQHTDVKIIFNRGGIDRDVTLNLDGIEIIIGHNLSYDLSYLWYNTSIQDYLKRGGKIWDTLLVEYLLDGQAKQLRDLSTLSIKYGGTAKVDVVKEAFKNGKGWDSIADDIALEYGRDDIINTELLYETQIAKVKANNMESIVEIYNKHALLVINAEVNGLHVDAERLTKDLDNQLNIQLGHREGLNILVSSMVPRNLYHEFNLDSGQHISSLLYNTPFKMVVDEPKLDELGEPLIYKSGTRKGEIVTKKIKKEFFIWGEELAVREPRTVDVESVTKMSQEAKDPRLREFCELLLEYRKTTKVISTYSQPFQEMTNEYTGCIHPKYSYSVTQTGRLASSNPNGQNLPSEILPIFTSRFKEGKILSFDFSQLEVVVQGWITGCKQLLKDAEDGVDFHVKRLAYATNLPYEEVFNLCETSEEWKEKRRWIAKPISFQKAYGAAPESIARDTGIPLNTVKAVFEAEDREYPEIPEFYKAVVEQLGQKAEITNKPASVFNKATGAILEQVEEKEIISKYQSVTGKLYTFTMRQMLTRRGIFRYWKMPEVQNYPIQGTAADIVSYVGGNLFNYLLKNNDTILIIGEVHDSFIFDVKKDHLEQHISNICAILTNVGDKFPGLKLNVSHGVGDNWYAAKKDES